MPGMAPLGLAKTETAQHTPGPWKHNVGTAPECYSWRITGNHDHESVCCCNGNVKLPGDRKAANARLIAAAPELLEALKRIMSYAHTGAHASDIDTNEQPEFVNARAAISKAEGK